LRQTMVDSWYCLDRVVPEGMSQVSRRSKVGNHKRRTLNTRLSSGTSAGTFVVSMGPYTNYRAEASTKNESGIFFVPVPKKVWKIGFSRFEPKVTMISFSRGSGPHLLFLRPLSINVPGELDLGGLELVVPTGS